MTNQTPTVRLFPQFFLTYQPPNILFIGQPDTDSDHDVYGGQRGQSVESLHMGNGRAPAPTFGDLGSAPYGAGREPYPAWGAERAIPLSKEEIEDIFLDLQQKFGFQRDSMRNMVCLLGSLSAPITQTKLDSSTSQCSFLIAVRPECLQIRPSSPFTRTISAVNTQTIASGTLQPNSILTMPSAIPKTLVSSVSAQSVVAAVISRKSL